MKKRRTARLNIVVPRADRERLERLLELTDAVSLTEVIRWALVVYDDLVGVREEGGRIIIESADGERSILRLTPS